MAGRATATLTPFCRFDGNLPVPVNILWLRARVAGTGPMSAQTNRITCRCRSKRTSETAIRKRRIECFCVVVERKKEMVASKDCACSRAFLRSIEQRSMKIAAGAGDLKLNWNLLAMDSCAALPCPVMAPFPGVCAKADVASRKRLTKSFIKWLDSFGCKVEELPLISGLDAPSVRACGERRQQQKVGCACMNSE